MVKNDERQFESDIEALMTGEFGWQNATERGYLKWRDKALVLERLVDFMPPFEFKPIEEEEQK